MTTTVLMPSIVFREYDNNGNPLAFGKLFTYQAGSTTKLATYTDSTGVTPNTNPVILNSRGEAQVWLPPNVAYKFVSAPSTDTDPPTNPIRTVDQVIQSQILTLYGGVDSGIVNAYVINYAANFTSYVDGIGIYWIPAHTNTGPSTINVNGLGVVNIVNQDGSALGSNQLIANQIAFILCKGGQFLLSSVLGSGGVLTVAAVNLTGTTIPANGWYLPSPNVIGLATNSILRMQMDSNGHAAIFAPVTNGLSTLNIGGIAGGANPLVTFETLNSINASRSAATYETGSFTGTLTGCTTSPTATVNWSRNGNAVTLEIPALSATSNSVALTITGLPASLTPARAQTFAFPSLFDNSVNRIIGEVTVTGTTLAFGVGVVSGTRYTTDTAGFTAAGTKGIGSYAASSITYNLT